MRIAAAVLVAVATFLLGAPSAAAADLGWWLTAQGSAHCTQDANHIVCQKYDRSGRHVGAVVDFWLPGFCQFHYATAGDNAGTPLRLRLRSPYTAGEGCQPNGQSPYWGWHNGHGYAEGQNYWAPSYVTEETVYVFPRDTATPAAFGTQVTIY